MDSSPLKLLGLSLVLGLALYLFAQKWSDLQETGEALLQSELSMREDRSFDRFQELALEPRRISAEDLSSARERLSVSQPCLDHWSQIQALDLSSVGEELDIPETVGCERGPESVESARLTLEARCQHLSPEETEELSEKSATPAPSAAATAAALAPADVQKKDQECLEALFLYRAQINSYLHQNEGVEEITDVPLLLDLLFTTHQKPSSEASTAQLDAVAERLHRLEPELYEPVKALALSHWRKLSNHPSEEDLRELDDRLNLALEYRSDDPDVWEMQIFARSRGMEDLAQADNLLRQAREEDQFPELVDFYEALLEESRGNRERAWALLQSAAEIAPQNPKIARAIQILRPDQGEGSEIPDSSEAPRWNSTPEGEKSLYPRLISESVEIHPQLLPRFEPAANEADAPPAPAPNSAAEPENSEEAPAPAVNSLQ